MTLPDHRERPGDWFVEAWVAGWVSSRKPPAAEPIDGGWFIRISTEREACRWVLTLPDPELLGKVLAGSVPESGCVKFAGDPRIWMPGSPTAGSRMILAGSCPASSMMLVRLPYLMGIGSTLRPTMS